MVLLKFIKSKISQFMMKTNRIVFLRHGESDFNQLNLFCGWHDAPLSEAGKIEARQIAAHNLLAAKMEFDVVYTSMLCRAQQSTELILRELNSSYLPIKTDWRLNERHYGDLTGRNKRQVMEKYGESQLQEWRRGYDGLPPAITPENQYYYRICDNPVLSDIPPSQFPTAESMHMCADRVKPAWDEIKQEMMRGKRILICTHGTVARALVKHIEGLSNEDISKVNIPNSIPCVYEFSLKTGELIGGLSYLGDPEYIKEKSAEVAAVGK